MLYVVTDLTVGYCIARLTYCLYVSLRSGEKNLIFFLCSVMSYILVEIDKYYQAGFFGLVNLSHTAGQCNFIVTPVTSSYDFIN